jgi:membrane-bound metal-dependent hydrolase YbcI (DUF457 family)
MTGKTHRIVGVVACLSGYLLLEKNGMLLGDVNPILQLAVMYPFAMYGSTVSDLDHHWQSAPSKDVVSFVINKLLHINPNSKNSFLNAKHRSWQTHSDLFLALMIVIGVLLFTATANTPDQILIRLIFSGLILGIISHLVLDMLTPAGIWSLALLLFYRIFNIKKKPYKIDLVPDTKFFATNGPWEHYVQVFLWWTSIILLAITVYTMI